MYSVDSTQRGMDAEIKKKKSEVFGLVTEWKANIHTTDTVQTN